MFSSLSRRILTPFKTENYKFLKLPRHKISVSGLRTTSLTDKEAEKAHMIGDPLAESYVEQLYKSNWEFGKPLKKIMYANNNSDISKIEGISPIIVDFYMNPQTNLPHWIDFDKLRKGQQFCNHFYFPLHLGLMYNSLPQTYAYANGAKLLVLSERLINGVNNRTLRTNQWFKDVCVIDSFLPDGNAIRTCQTLRLMHSSMRYHYTKGKYKHLWNVSTNGIPVSQLYYSLTLNNAFYKICLDSLDLLGCDYTTEEREAFLYFWNVTGYLLGINENYLYNEKFHDLLVDDCNRIGEKHIIINDDSIELMTKLKEFYDTLSPGKKLDELHYSLFKYFMPYNMWKQFKLPDGPNINSLIPYMKLVFGGLDDIQDESEILNHLLNHITKFLLDKFFENLQNAKRIPFYLHDGQGQRQAKY